MQGCANHWNKEARLEFVRKHQNEPAHFKTMKGGKTHKEASAVKAWKSILKEETRKH